MAQETPTDVTDWVGTGSTLDLAISNRPHGGLAGRITEINGLEGSGKSLIGVQCIPKERWSGSLHRYRICCFK